MPAQRSDGFASLDILTPQRSRGGTLKGPNDQIRVTLDLLPEDAQRLVFAQENGLVWLGLLHPEEGDGHGQPDPALVPVELLLGRRGR